MRTLPSVTPRSVSTSSSHCSAPSRALTSVNHDIVISTIAWTTDFSWPCFLLRIVTVELRRE